MESEISKILRGTFSFRIIALEGRQKRIGKEGLESKLIGTAVNCNTYKASENGLGRSSTTERIRNGKLWLSRVINLLPAISSSELTVT